MTHYVTHLEAAIDGAAIPFGRLIGTHAGRPVVVRYDLAPVQAASPADIAAAAKP